MFNPSYRAHEDSVRRKPRSLSATDTEWQRIRETCSSQRVCQFRNILVERALEPVIENLQKVVGPQPPWLRRAARDCIALGIAAGIALRLKKIEGRSGRT